MILRFMLVTIFLKVALSQKPSPCPGIFTYRGTEEDRWYATVELSTTEELTGIWLRVSLDNEAQLLGNWFGEAVSTNNKDFVIKNPSFRLEPGKKETVRFFVKYNPASIVPSVQSIRLNGKNVCVSSSQPETSTSTNLLSTSGSIRPNRPGNTPSLVGQQPIRNKPQPERATTSRSPTTEEEVYTPSHRPPILQQKKVACGTVSTKASPLITHGQKTIPGQWPWHAALYHLQGIQLMYICGGTLISDKHVVTAAHCVTRPSTTRPVNPEKIVVILGKHNLISAGPGVQDFKTSQIFVHPEYNATAFFNDIAVLKLGETVEFTNTVRPCCLWSESTDIDSTYSKLGTVVGWGYDESGKLSENLLLSQMPVIRTLDCIYSNRDFFAQFIFEKNFCAGYTNGTSVCNGDSGGGLVFRKPGSTDQNPVWQIRGLVSVGVALQGQQVCDASHYVIFTDVAKHLNWIDEVMRN